MRTDSDMQVSTAPQSQSEVTVTTFGTVTRTASSTTIAATGETLRHWANRGDCGWHDDKKAIGDARALALWLKETCDVDELREKVDGCPACMLAVVVQSAPTARDRDHIEFEYTTECERFRIEERDRWQRSRKYAI